MWKLVVDLSWRDVQPKTFEDYDDAQWAFRGAITKVLGKDQVHLKFFWDLIDKYFSEFHGNVPMPSEVERLKEFVTRYVTDPTYPADTKNFSFPHFEDDNIEIYYNTKNKSVELRLKNNNIAGKIPVISIPVEVESFENTLVSFLISNNPMLFAPIPGTETVNICIEPDEDEDEDEDEDDFDFDDEDEEDDESDYDYQIYTKPSHSAPQTNGSRLTYFEKREIENAKNRYEKIARYVATGRLKSIYNAADEKRAYAEYLQVLAKYAGKS